MNGITCRCVTCCAVAPSRVLRAAWVPYGNMETSTPRSSETSQVITMKLWLGRSVEHIYQVWLASARYGSLHAYVHTSLPVTCLASWLPAFFSCAPAQAKRIAIISRTMAQKTQFSVRKCHRSKCIFLFWRFGYHSFPRLQNFAPSQIKKSNNDRSR